MTKRIIVSGIILTGLWLLVALMSLGISPQICEKISSITPHFFQDAVSGMQNGFYYDTPNENMPTVVFLVIFSMAFLVYFFVSLKLVLSSSQRKGFLVIAFFAILFRIILLPSVPIHENDVYRYMWDGKVSANGINPYKYAPEDLEVTEEFSEYDRGELARLNLLRSENEVYFDRIGHKSVPTIYPPAAQVFFLLSNLVKPDSVIVLKTIFVIFDLMTFFLIAKILSLLGRNPSCSIIYGWSPLVLKEISNSAHYDSIPIFFMMLFLYFAASRKRVKAGLSLAMASASKFFPIVLLPLSFRRLGWKVIGMTLVIFGAVYIPFFVWGGTGIKQVFEGLRIYSEQWAYNGSIYVVIRSAVNSVTGNFEVAYILAKIISLVLLALLVIFLSFKKESRPEDFLKKVFITMSGLFLLSPVGDPWYFCWVIPLLCFFPYRSFIVLSGLLMFSYLSFNHDYGYLTFHSFKVPILSAIQYVPFFVILLFEIVLSRRKGTFDV